MSAAACGHGVPMVWPCDDCVAAIPFPDRAWDFAAKSGPVCVRFDLRGAVMTDDLLRRMHEVSARHAAEAARAAFDASNNRTKTDER